VVAEIVCVSLIDPIAQKRQGFGKADGVFEQAIGVVFVFADPGYRLGVERRPVELKIVGRAVEGYSDDIVVLVDVVKANAELATGGGETQDVFFHRRRSLVM
jgi:hypothetical protein